MMTVAAILIKVTVILAVALVGTRFGRRHRAAARHVFLAVSFALLLVLPIASLVAPTMSISIPAAALQGVASYSVEKLPSDLSPASTGSVGDDVIVQPLRSSLSALLFTGWMIGSIAFLLPMVSGLWQIRALRSSGQHWRQGQSILKTLATEAGIHAPIELLLHKTVSGPMTCGVLRRTVLLPLDARVWVEEDLRRALIHELEHVSRRDWLTQCFARVMCACYWFHPLVWMARRKIVLEAEHACDDAVLRRSEPTAYADQLVRLAERLSANSNRPLLAMAAPRDLTMRVRAVLDARQSRGRAGAFCVAAACAAAIFLVIALPNLQIVTAAPLALPQTQTSSVRLQTKVEDARFEVASVRVNRSGEGASRMSTLQPGRFTVENMPLRALVLYAYGIQEAQLIGGPSWMKSETFDISAKAEAEVSRERRPAMLRNLLKDRFGLVLRRETRELPVYALVRARRDGRLGPQLRASNVDCDALAAEALAGDAAQACTSGVHGADRMILRGKPMAHFVDGASNWARQMVVDRTGLSGTFDLDLSWTAFNISGDSEGLSMFKAIEDQLGLKLDLQKLPVEVFVVEQIEHPSDN